MGWNDVEPVGRAHPLADGLPACAYFAHSFAVRDAGPAAVAETRGRRRALRLASSAAGRVAGAQFHPERSSRRRAAMLRGFLGGAMLRRRVIPCLDVSGGRVVKGVNFVNLRDCGDPVSAAVRYAEQGADEICWLNITAGDETWRDLLARWSAPPVEVDVPVTVGGGVKEERHVRDLLAAGADKVSINSAALRDPGAGRRVRGARTARSASSWPSTRSATATRGARTSAAGGIPTEVDAVAWAEGAVGARRGRAARHVDGHRRHASRATRST